MCNYCVETDGNQMDSKDIAIQSCLFFNACGLLRNRIIPDCATMMSKLVEEMRYKQYISACSRDMKFRVNMGDALKIKLTARPPEKFSFEDGEHIITITDELFKKGIAENEEDFLLPAECKGTIHFTHFMQHLPKDGKPGKSITHNKDRICIGRDSLTEISGVTKDSGIGSSLGSKSANQQASKRSEKSRTKGEKKTHCGSLTDDISCEQLSLLRQEKNPEFSPEALRLQKQEMKLLVSGSKERRHDKINRWLQGYDMDLCEDEESLEGISTTVCKLPTYDDILVDDIDLSEDGEIHGDIPTAVGKLMMYGFNPLLETLKIFSNCLQDINLQVHELDLGNNVVLGDPEINHIGVIVRHSNVSKLLLQDCELKLDTMLKLQTSMNDTMLTDLDVSKAKRSEKSAKLGPDGMAVLGNIVSNCGIQKLALRNHDLRQEHISKLRQSLVSAKLSEVDVSGNDSLGPDGIAELAGIVHETEVRTLILRDCGLNFANLLKLKDSIGNSKLTKLDVSENTRLGTSGMTYIGIIAKQCQVADLLLRDCLVTPDHMTALKHSLDGFMLVELDIGKSRAPAQALSNIYSESTNSSDDTGDADEDDRSKVISESPEEHPTDTSEKHVSSESTNSEKEDLSRFQPEQLVINLLPNVKKHIKVDNWEIDKGAEKILEDEMRKRKLPHLEISFGSGSQKKAISLSIHREHTGKQMGTTKKVSWADALSTSPITEQHAEETGKDVLEKISEGMKLNLKLEGKSTEREDTQAPDDAEENEKAEPASMLPATAEQLLSIQGGNQAALDWQERQGAIGGETSVVDMTSTSPDDSPKKSTDLQMQEQQFCSDVISSSSAAPTGSEPMLSAIPGQLQNIQGGNQAASARQEQQSCIGGRPGDSPKKLTDLQMQEQQFCGDVTNPADLLLHHKGKNFSEETPPAKELNPKAEGTSVESFRPDTTKWERIREDGPYSKDTTGVGGPSKQAVAAVEWSTQKTAQRKYIGKEGGEVNICGCKIAFPCNALETEKEIQVSICPDVEEDLDIPGLDSDTIAVTPTFQFKPSVIFKKPVSIEMATCLRAISDKIPVVVLMKKVGKPWEVTARTFVGKKGVIRFETLHFCRVQSQVSEDNASEGEWLLTNSLYINKITTCLTSLFMKNPSTIKEMLQERHYDPLPIMPEELMVKVGDHVDFRMECTDPKETRVIPLKASFTVTQKFLKKKNNQKHFKMDPKICEKPSFIWMDYYVKVNDEDEAQLPFGFHCPLAEYASTGPQKNHGSVRVDVNIDNRDIDNINANKVAQSQGQINTKAENSTFMASQRRENADIPSTSRENAG